MKARVNRIFSKWRGFGEHSWRGLSPCSFALVTLMITLGLSSYAYSQSKPRNLRAEATQANAQISAAAQQSFNKALDFLEHQDLVNAEREAQNTVRLAPRSPVAHNILGVVFDQQGKLDQAGNELNAAIRLDANFVSARNNLGKVLAAQGKLKEAQAQFEYVLKLDPHHIQARYNLAALYAEMGDYAKAADNFLALWKENPDDAQIAFAFLNVAYRAGRTQEADDATNFLERAANGDTRATFTLAVALAEGQQYERALRLFLKVNDAQASPTFEVLYNIGLALDNLKRQDQALPYLAKAADLKPEAVEVHFRLAVIASERSDSVNAVEEFRHCIERQPRNPYFHYLLGREYFRAGFWEGAISAYSEAIRINPKEVAYLVGRANASYRKGEWTAAAADYDAVAEIQPDFKDIDYLRGYVHRAAGDFEKARELLDQFITRNPSDVEALASLGYVAIEQGRLSDAEAALKKALSIDEHHAAALYDYARVAIKQRDYQSAVERLEKLITINKYNPQAYYQIFLAYSRLKQNDKAKEALDEFKRLDGLEKQARQERIFDERIRAQKLLGQ